MSKKRTLWTLLGIMMIAAMLISACASATEAPTEAAPEEMPEEEMSFEGETVTIFTAAGEDQARAFQDELKRTGKYRFFQPGASDDAAASEPDVHDRVST